MSDFVVEQSAQPIEKTSSITFQEFLKRYDGQHAEWLMGEVSVQVANNARHQQLLIFLVNLLSAYLGIKPVGQLMLAGFSMYISDDNPAREPDLMVILNENAVRITDTYLNGPADIAIEIVSPESVIRDYGDKFKEYEAAGVREYWLFDPLRHRADINVLGEDGLYTRLPLDSDGRLRSKVLPDFTLKPDVLWAESYPPLGETVQLVNEMLQNN